MLNPISIAFKKAKQENRAALLTYTVAGDSSKKQSLDILKSISKNADILEVGVPHNTPVADGSQIKRFVNHRTYYIFILFNFCRQQQQNKDLEKL